jgi:glucose-6-phosphate isomerase
MPLISESAEWKKLQAHAATVQGVHLKTLLQDAARCAALTAEFDGITLDFSRENVMPETMEMLFDLAGAAGLEQKRAAMAAGAHINSTEDRAVMHVALRAPRSKQLVVDGADVVPAVHAVLDKIADFSARVRDGTWVGATGKKLTTVVAIGIGGSYLGPEFVFEALRTDAAAAAAASGRTLRFLANVDPVDVARALSGLVAEETLVIVVSKTFTTAETMLNARTLKAWLLDNVKGAAAADVIRQHMIAVSSAIPKAVDFGISAENVFGFWDWVGGRFSVCSAVGVMPLALQYGMPVVQEFLAGAHSMDTHFFETPLRANLPVLLGLLGVWNASFLGHGSRAILPYAQALVRFAAHIQQVDMESNGKRVALDGTALPYACGEIIFGEPGTNGQQSFYQLVHQGRIVPAEFIGFSVSPNPIRLPGEPVSNHDELMSNFFAQPDALAYGKTVAELQAEGVPAHLHAHKVRVPRAVSRAKP